MAADLDTILGASRTPSRDTIETHVIALHHRRQALLPAVES